MNPRARKTLNRLTLNVVAGVIAVLMAFPVYWMVTTALKPKTDVFTRDLTLFPETLTLSHFKRVVADESFLRFAGNSLFVTLVVVAVTMVVGFLAATAMARFDYKGRKASMILILAIQMVPLEALLISMYVMLESMGLLDRLMGVMVAYLALALPFTVWTLRGFVANIPAELEEAALIDGCSRLQSFRRILLPLIAPGLVAASVFAFILAWNEFILANVVLLSKQNATLPLWLASFQSSFKEIDWSGLMAASTLFALPVIVFFVAVQGRLHEGAAAGGVKG